MGLAALGFLAFAWVALLSPAARLVWRRRLAGILPHLRARADAPEEGTPAPEDRRPDASETPGEVEPEARHCV